MRILPLALLGACVPELPVVEDPQRCGAERPELELFAASQDGALEVGVPPQGGAPYTPLLGRLRGLEAGLGGLHFEMTAVDADTGELLGDTALDTRWICANVGENADWMVGAELHLRYLGLSVDALADREVEITVEASDEAGDVATDTLRGPLFSR